MEASEWVARCSARLHAQWPRLQREQRDEVASDLWSDARWQAMEPEAAVVAWLRQGLPSVEEGTREGTAPAALRGVVQ